MKDAKRKGKKEERKEETVHNSIALPYRCWFKHILFVTEHEKALGRAEMLC